MSSIWTGEFLLVKSWFVPRLQKLFKKNKILLRFLFFPWISINSLNELMKELWLGKFWSVLGSSWSLVGRLSWYFSCPLITKQICKYSIWVTSFKEKVICPRKNCFIVWAVKIFMLNKWSISKLVEKKNKILPLRA